MQLVSDDQAHTTRRMDVAKIPRTALARGSNEWSAIGAQPIHAVAAVAKGDVCDLGASISLADLVGRPAMYEEAPEHDALIRDRGHVIELRRVTQLRVGQIERVRFHSRTQDVPISP